MGGTPGAADVGANQFTIRATDGDETFAETTLNIFVHFANQPPVFLADPISQPSSMARLSFSGVSLAGFADDPESAAG